MILLSFDFFFLSRYSSKVLRRRSVYIANKGFEDWFVINKFTKCWILPKNRKILGIYADIRRVSWHIGTNNIQCNGGISQIDLELEMIESLKKMVHGSTPFLSYFYYCNLHRNHYCDFYRNHTKKYRKSIMGCLPLIVIR